MDVSEMGCPLSSVLFNIFLEKIMQQNLTLHCCCCSSSLPPRRSISSANYSEVTTHWKVAAENSWSSFWIRYRNQFPTKPKSLSTASSQGHLNICMHGKVLEEVGQFKYLGSTKKQGWNIIEGSEDQTDASTLNHDNVSSAVEQDHQHNDDHTHTARSVWLRSLVYVNIPRARTCAVQDDYSFQEFTENTGYRYWSVIRRIIFTNKSLITSVFKKAYPLRA